MALLKSMKTHETPGEKFLKEMKVKLDNMSDDEFNERVNAVCDDTDTGYEVSIKYDTGVYSDRFEITPDRSYPWNSFAPDHKINFLESNPDSVSYAYEECRAYQVRYTHESDFNINAPLLNYSDIYDTTDSYYIHIGNRDGSSLYDYGRVTLKFFTLANGYSYLYAKNPSGEGSVALIERITPGKIDALIRVLQTLKTTI